MGGADNLIDPSNLKRLIEHNIPFPNLEDTPIPVKQQIVSRNYFLPCSSRWAFTASSAYPLA